MSNISNTKSLVAVQGTTQFVAALISLLWYEKKSDVVTDAVLLIYDTSVPEENEPLMLNAIMKLASIRKWAEIIVVDKDKMRSISLNRYKTSITKLTEVLKEVEFDQIFVARGFGSFGTHLILNSYPNAKRIEYGDSYGLVGNETDLSLSFKDFMKSPLISTKSFAKKLIYLQFPKRFEIDQSILTMPLDWYGSYLTDKDLIIPDKSFATEVFYRLSLMLQDLGEYCNNLIHNIDGECRLYLLSNFYNSGFSTQENEIRLYEEVIRSTAAEGTTIIIKNHPRGSDSTINALYDKLNVAYHVILIDDKQFNFYPIELWNPLVSRCEIYPIFSSSVISLYYLFSKKVIMPLNEELILKYIYKNKIPHTLASEDMCREAIVSIAQWDGKTPIWKKK